MVRILHTSDWHLGKKLYKKERWPEQVQFLKWLVQTIIQERIDILIIAGDLFDTSMPPTYALKGLFDFYKKLEEIAHLKKIVVIGGNHDSGKLIETPIPLLGEKFEILGRPDSADKADEEEAQWLAQHKITFKRDENSIPISIALFPFFRASDILVSDSREDNLPPDEMLLDSIKKWIEKWSLNSSHYNILVGHHLFGSFLESGSEQGVGLSGLASIPLSLFEKWDLLCLGHIHKPQCLKKCNPKAYYSGSPIPMRFSEKEEKSVIIFDIDSPNNSDKATQKQTITEIIYPIPTFRALIQLESSPKEWERSLDEILEAKANTTNLSPFLELTLHFDRPTPSYIDTVREVLSQRKVELLNYYQVVDANEQESKEKTLDAKQVQSARMDELFDLYLAEQELESEQRKEVKITYQKLMDEILTGDHS